MREHVIKIEWNDEDQCITQETSIRLKNAFHAYYGEHGVPAKAEDIQDSELRTLALTYQEEW